MKKSIKPQKKTGLAFGISKNPLAEYDEQELLSNMFLLSFKDLDRSQGQTLEEWEREGILARAMDVLRNYCCAPLLSQCNTDKFTNYGKFPPSKDTEFTHPKHVPDDAEWARIHVTGRQCIAGHVLRNVFYVVFLDKDHGFYISKLKHT